MKLEFKTDNENYSQLFGYVFRTIFGISLIIVFCDVALKMGVISKYLQLDYNCKLLSVEKSNFNFKELSRISNLKSKQKIWEFCREVVK